MHGFRQTSYPSCILNLSQLGGNSIFQLFMQQSRYPAEIHHAIYTTNAIESLNSVIRHSTKKRKIFSSDDSVKKVIYLATTNAAKKWTMPIQNWRLAMNWFTIHFDDRLKDHL
ncbi:transposase [Acinetobacter sp. 1125_18A]|uniref:transposase n=1 Tax=Acinetobacter sp. 1125_18A TaxID=2605959 RepID=UPI004058AE17